MIPKSLFFSVLLFGWQIQAATAADAAHGRELAQRWCAACHSIARAPQSTTEVPPSFVAVANLPNFDASRLVYFLLAPHPKMPAMDFSRAEVNDLAAYITSLRN